MMKFLVLAGACVAFAPMMLLNKVYQRRAAQRLESSFWVMVITGTVVVLLGLPLTGFKPSFSLPSLLYSLGYALGCMFTSIFIFVGMQRTRVAVVSLFVYSGGMLLPSVYGILRHGETLTVWKVLGILLILASFLPTLLGDRTNTGKTSGKRVIPILLLAFVSNGIIGVFSKANVMNARGIENMDFIVWAGIWETVLALLMLGMNRLRGGETTLSPRCIALDGQKKTYYLQVGAIALCAVTNSISNLLSLVCNGMMDSSLQYPLFNASQITFAVLLSAWILKEKLNRATVLQVCICVVGILTLIF